MCTVCLSLFVLPLGVIGRLYHCDCGCFWTSLILFYRGKSLAAGVLYGMFTYEPKGEQNMNYES